MLRDDDSDGARAMVLDDCLHSSRVQGCQKLGFFRFANDIDTLLDSTHHLFLFESLSSIATSPKASQENLQVFLRDYASPSDLIATSISIARKRDKMFGVLIFLRGIFA